MDEVYASTPIRYPLKDEFPSESINSPTYSFNLSPTRQAVGLLMAKTRTFPRSIVKKKGTKNKILFNGSLTVGSLNPCYIVKETFEKGKQW